VRVIESPPTPRCWFLNQEETELIQVQPDRFVHNWRRAGADAEYPRYQKLRQTFRSDLKRFCEYVKREGCGQFVPNQCEVTYVNRIHPGPAWQSHDELDKIVAFFSGACRDDFLSAPEDARIQMRFLIPAEGGEPVGRLHTVIEPRFRAADGAPLYTFTLTARGKPSTEDIKGVMGFLDLGHEWVVRGFASMTTESMHREWGRTDVRVH
jgi:uncharacterized protein (TIGR04255 family)